VANYTYDFTATFGRTQAGGCLTKNKICCSGRAHSVPCQVAPFSFFFAKLNYGVTGFELFRVFVRGLISFVGIIFGF